MNDQLLQGQEFNYSDEDGSMVASVFYADRLNKFVIELNGKFVCTSKTFAPMQKKLRSLCEQYEMAAV